MKPQSIRVIAISVVSAILATFAVSVVQAQVILEPLVTSDMTDPLTSQNFTDLSTQPSLGHAGMAFRAMSCTDETCDVRMSSIYRMSSGGLEVLVNELTLVPGHGDTFHYFSNPIQDGSDVVFQGGGGLGCPPGPCGVYTIREGVLEVVAEAGGTTPAGGTYQMAQAPDMEAGILVLHAYVDNGGTPYEWEIHADFGEGLEVVLDADTVVPGTSETFYSIGPPTTGGGRIVFAGMRQDYTNALYQYKDGVLTALVDESTPIPGETWHITDAHSPSLVGNVLTFQGRTSDDVDSLFADFGDGIVQIISSFDDVPLHPGLMVNWIHTPAVSGDELVFVVEDIWYDSHVLYYRHRDGQLSWLFGTGSMLDGKAVGYYIETGADSGYQETFVVHVTFEGYPAPLAIYAFRRVAGLDVVMDAIPDANKDGHPEVATVMPDLETFASTVHITNPVTGGTVAKIDFDYGQVVGMATMPDFADAPSDEMALLMSRDAEAPMVQTRDCMTGARIRDQQFFDMSWAVKGMVTVPDLNANGMPEMGVLAKNVFTDEVAVQLRDGSTGQFIRNLFFKLDAWTPLQAVVIPNLAGSKTTHPEIGVLARHDVTGQIVVMIKDAGEQDAFVTNVFFLNTNWTPRDLVVMERYAGVDSPVLALLATRNDTGKMVTMIRDPLKSNPALGPFNYFNVFHLSTNWTPVALTEVADSDDEGGGTELTVLAKNNDSGQVIAQSKDSTTNDHVAHALPVGSLWQALEIVSLGDIDGVNGDEIAVLAIRLTDGTVVVQTKGAISNDLVSNAFLN